MRAARTALFLLAASALAGCSFALAGGRHLSGEDEDARAPDEDAGVDAGVDAARGDAGAVDDASSDAAVPDDTAVLPDAYLFPALRVAGGLANYGCIGSTTAPADIENVTATLILNDYPAFGTMPGERVEIWRTDSIGAVCGGTDCTTVTTDTAGEANVGAPGNGWVTMRTLESPNTVLVLTQHVPWPGVFAGVINPWGAPLSALESLSTELGRTFALDADATVIGTVFDCDGLPVRNAQIRLFAGRSEIVDEGQTGTGPRVTGITGLEPTIDGLTADAGTFAALRATGGTYRIEVLGARTEGGPLERVGCEEIETVVNGLSVLRVGPLRSDYPVLTSDCEGAP